MGNNDINARAASFPRVHSILAALSMAVGVLILLVTVPTEAEPTAVPLVLIVLGIVWYFATRRRQDPSPSTTYRLAVGIALAAAFLLLWLSLGVGIIGADGDPANMMFFGVIAVGLIGAFAGRWRSQAMALSLLAMAIAQTVVFLIAWIGQMGLPWSGPLELLGLNGFFVALFVGSAGLFRSCGLRQEEGSS